MKMTLRDRITRAKEFLSDDNPQCLKSRMDWNDKEVVFYASAMVGSSLNKRYNRILMNRNALPLCWYDNPDLSSCVINAGFKKAYKQVDVYLERRFSVTRGRLNKLLELLAFRQPKRSRWGRELPNNEFTHIYLRNLNNLRTHYAEMSEAEIYDFSFDMVYEFIEEFSFSTDKLSLALLIMYWIQRENKLIPLAMTCSQEEFIAFFDTPAEDSESESEASATARESKRRFRLFMRKLLDRHLKEFIRNNTKDNETKETSRDRILKLIKNKPTHTAKMMASSLGLSVQAVRKQIATLKKENRLERIGPDKGGSWKVIDGKVQKKSAINNIL